MTNKLLNIKAPDFNLLDASETNYSLKDFKNKNIVLYFYPKDSTPGCTIEANEFSALKKEFEKLNTAIIGISKDSCASHQKFIDKQSLKILLLSDPDHKTQEDYQVYKLKSFMGRKFMGTIRSTFILDKKQNIVKIWENVKAKNHAKEVLEYIKDNNNSFK